MKKFLGKRLLFVFLFLALLAGAGLSLLHVNWQEDLLADLPGNTPELATARAYLQSFAGHEPLAIEVDARSCPNPRADAAEAADDLAQRLMATGFFKRVDAGLSPEAGPALWNILAGRLPYLLDPVEYPRVRARLHEARGRLEEFKRTAMFNPFSAGLSEQVRRDPLGLTELVLANLRWLSSQEVTLSGTRLVSTDGNRLLMLAYPSFPASDTRRGEAMMLSWQTAVSEIQAGRGERAPGFFAIGPHRSYADNARQIKHDVNLSASVSVGVILLLAYLALRRPWLAPLSLLPSVAGLAAGLAIVGLCFNQFSLIIWGMISAMLGITVDYGLHVLMAIQRAPQDPVAAVRPVRLPTAVCALTTAGSFLALLVTHFPGQYRLAWFSFAGVMMAALVALTALPLWVPAASTEPRKPYWDLDAFSDRLEVWGHRHWVWVAGGFIFLAALAWAGLPRLTFVGDPEAMNALAPQTHAAEKHFAEAFGDPAGRLTVFQKGRTPEEALRQAERLNIWLQSDEARKVVEPAATLAALVPSRAVQEKRALAFKREFGPGGAQLMAPLVKAGQAVNFKPGTFSPFAAVLASPEPPLVPQDFIRAGLGDLIRGHWLVTTRAESIVITPLKPKPGLSGAEVEAALQQAGLPIIVLDKRGLAGSILKVLRADFKPAVVTALFIVALLVYAAKKRIELVIAALIPLSAAFILTLGTLAWLKVPINLINLASAPLLMGVGVDYAVFRIECALAKYRGEPLPAGSIVLAALTTLAGFGALMLAGHPALRSVGIALFVGVAWALVCALLLVPILMRLFLPADPAVPPRSLKIVMGGVYIYTCLAVTLVICLVVVLPVLVAARLLKRDLDAQRYLYWCAWYIMHIFPYGRRIYDPCKTGKMAKPAIVVANHEALVDILFVLSLTPGLHAVVKPWVWNHPVLGPLVRAAGFVLATGDNTQQVFEQCRENLKSGKSLVIYPEGTRSRDGIMRRFHKGAFQLSVNTGFPIQPLVLVDTRSCTPGNSWFVGNHAIAIATLDPIKPQDFTGEDPGTQMARETRRRVQEMKERLWSLSRPAWLVRQKIRERYLFLGPLVETYLAWKLRLDPVYAEVGRRLNQTGRVLDLGCGYGSMSHWAAITGYERPVTGVDDDERKIALARQTMRYQRHLVFECKDLLDYHGAAADFIIMLDVLHYSTPERQIQMLRHAAGMLSDRGTFFVREAVQAQGAYQATEKGEVFSTQIGFNKKRDGLFFTDLTGWEKRFKAAGLSIHKAMPCGLGKSNYLFILKGHSR